MTSVRLTETFVKSMHAPPSGNRIVYDSDLKGFGARVTAKGAKAFVLNYRAQGHERRLTIGGFPEWSVTAARRYAEGLKRSIDLGRDPMAERREEREAATVADLCDLYVERHAIKKRESSQRNDLSMIRRIVKPRIGNAKVKAVRHSDIEQLHLEVSKQAPMTANRLVALLSKMFALSISWEMRSDNPARGIGRNQEEQRNRYLSCDELARFCQALTTYPNAQVSNSIALLLVTGARKTEVLSARWFMIDLINGYWTKPKENTKQGRMHRIPLSSAALNILAEIYRTRDVEGDKVDFLFPSHSKVGHLSELKGAWSKICAAAKIENFRIHDLRHTYASHLASSGHSLQIIGALLGHSQAQTTHRYAHLQDAPLRVATESFATLFPSDRPLVVAEDDR